MSDLLKAYTALRESGRGHWSACVALGRRYGLDRETISRTANRAIDEERRFAERELLKPLERKAA